MIATHPAAPPRLNPKDPRHRATVVAELWQDLHDMAAEVFAERMPHSPADFADRMTALLRERWGGAERYIPAGDTTRRDRAIRQQFDGRNLIDVCITHGVSPSTVYRACRPELRRGLS